MLAIPSSVWKVGCFHYSLSRFTAAVAVLLRGGPGGTRLARWPCEPQQCGEGGGRGGERGGASAAFRDTRGLHLELQRHRSMVLTSGIAERKAETGCQEPGQRWLNWFGRLDKRSCW